MSQEATRAGAGIGMLPTFLASSYDDLHRVLTTEVAIPLHYWIVTRVESRRRPAVTAVIEGGIALLTSN